MSVVRQTSQTWCVASNQGGFVNSPEKIMSTLSSGEPFSNNTNHEQSRFVFFFMRDYFAIIVFRDCN